jgi:ABC-2 type transport system permease protein
VPTGSRRRQDLGALLAAALISAVVVAGTLVGPLLATLDTGGAPALALVLRILPTGWAGDAIAAASLGQPGTAVLLLVALLAADALCAAIWPRVLGARLVAQAASGRHAHGKATGRILPATVTGAVASRELRLWIRDPNRAGFLLIALVVGLGGCLVPLITHGAAQLLPFAGLGTALIAAAIAGNSYGFDGPAFGLTLTVAGAERHDVRGRQLAWFLIVGPYAILLSIAGLLVSGQSWAWPWVLALLPALLGGAAGIIPIMSLLAVQPLDDNGSPGPTWVVKAYATIVAVAVSTAPTVVLLVIGTASGLVSLTWIAILVGVLTGVFCAVVLGRIAGNRLAAQGPEVFQTLAGAVAGR